jgi:hypothetical protein
MTINERSTVVGIFPTSAQTESAINELQRMGFTDQNIGYLVRSTNEAIQGNVAGGILAANLGGGAIGAAASDVIGALTKMGIPEEEANYYQNEFEAGRVLVTVYAPNHQQQVLDVLRRSGAYDASRQQDAPDRARTPVYAQIRDTPSPANAYKQAQVDTQPETHVPAPQTYKPHAPNAPTDPNRRSVYNPDVPNDPNTPNAY